MYFSFGSYTITINKWETSGEMVIFSQSFGLDSIEIDSLVSLDTEYYSISYISNNDRLLIQLRTLNKQKPVLIFDYENQFLIIGLSDAIYFIDVSQKHSFKKIHIEYDVFYGFYTLHHLGIRDFFIAYTELSILSVNYHGLILWEYHSSDIITNILLNSNKVSFAIDQPSKNLMNLDLYTGKIL